MLTRFFAIALLLFGTLTMGFAANANAQPVEGQDYALLPNPQPTGSGKKIEVLEFFWYGCSHCFDTHPHIKEWLKKVPKDVSFQYVPGIFRPNWIPGAKTFYTLEAIGQTGKLHDKVYDAIHLEQLDLTRDEVLFDWVAKQGVDRKKFADTYNSFAVQNKATKSELMSKAYSLQGVPALVVDGKYLVTGKMGGTPEGMLKTVDQLVEKIRIERKKK